jgi:hypothetical protein
MTAQVTPKERDLRALARMISEHRADVPVDGLPPSLLADLADQIRCDVLSFEGFDSDQQKTWFMQTIPVAGDAVAEDLEAMHWEHYWSCQPCSYPDRTGDLRSIIKIADFYSTRQWHSSGMYSDVYRPLGFEHDLMLSLPAASKCMTTSGRTLRLFFFRGPGQDFSERDRALLMLLRPTCTTPISTPNTNATLPPNSPHGRPNYYAW